MIFNFEEYRYAIKQSDCKHVFIVSSPIVVFIAKLIINKFSIPSKDIIIIPERNTYFKLINSKSIYQKRSFIDRLIKRIFLFSYRGYQLRRKIEKDCDKFILYCDWDNREVVEILNSKKCFGNAYIEEGQLSFNNFNTYVFKKNRISQWMRLQKWFKNVRTMSKDSNIPKFNECFNNKAFAFFTIYKEAFPLVDKNKKYNFIDFEIIRKDYVPKLTGKSNIGIMCSPRRIKTNGWNECIKLFIESIPYQSVIKLHPEFYANGEYLNRFMEIFNLSNFKKIIICDQSTIIEAEMLFEKKVLYGPLSSLKTYTNLFGSKFIEISIY